MSRPVDMDGAPFIPVDFGRKWTLDELADVLYEYISLLRADICRRNPNDYECDCRTKCTPRAKHVMAHIEVCHPNAQKLKEGAYTIPYCTFPYCMDALQILMHFTNCQSASCDPCNAYRFWVRFRNQRPGTRVKAA